MTLQENEVIRAREAAFNYAHKYYDFTLEEDYYLNSLVANLLAIYKAKITNIDNLSLLLNENSNILAYRYTEEDIKDFNTFYLECLKFKSDFTLKLFDDEFYLNKFGLIVLTTNPEFKNKNVFELNMPEFKAIIEDIKHNVFTSKIYQYLALLIREKLGTKAYDIFNLANNHIISYEKTLNQKLKALNSHSKRVRVLK